MELSFSAPCERNKQPILELLTHELAQCKTVLEIGSGTGQHVVHSARSLADIEWQPTERAEGLASLQARIVAEAPANVRPAKLLDVTDQDWLGQYDAVFSSNTLHIMSWEAVRAFFLGVGRALSPSGCLCVYGPFLYKGGQTAASNLDFDRSLRDRDPLSGLRSFDAVNALAAEQALMLQADHTMPANNQLLIWRRA